MLAPKHGNSNDAGIRVSAVKLDPDRFKARPIGKDLASLAIYHCKRSDRF